MAYKQTVKTLKEILLNDTLLDDTLNNLVDELDQIQNAEPKTAEASRKIGWCACLLVERGIVTRKQIINLIRKDILVGDE